MLPIKPVTVTSALTLAPALLRDLSAVLEPVVMLAIMALSALVPSATTATHSQSAAFLSTAVKLLHYLTKQCHKTILPILKKAQKKRILSLCKLNMNLQLPFFATEGKTITTPHYKNNSKTRLINCWLSLFSFLYNLIMCPMALLC